MKTIGVLSDQARQELKTIMTKSPVFRQRQRAHAVLLSAKGYSLDDLADIFDADRDSIRSWLTHYETSGISGLSDDPKSGRPRLFSDDQAQIVIQAVTAHPQQIMQAQQALKKRT
jgi:transposase